MYTINEMPHPYLSIYYTYIHILCVCVGDVVFFSLLLILQQLTVPVMTIDKNEPDDKPANEKDESPNGKEITEKVIKEPKTTQSN